MRCTSVAAARCCCWTWRFRAISTPPPRNCPMCSCTPSTTCSRRSSAAAACAVEEAEAIIDLQVERYLAWRRAAELDLPLRRYRADAEAQRDELLARAREMLANGRDPQEVLEYLANTLTGKLLHAPSVRLREAAQLGDRALLDAATRLFGADDRS